MSPKRNISRGHRRSLRSGVAAACLAASTVLLGADPAAATITKASWGTTPDGAKVDLYTLRNAKGMEVQIATYGGTLVSMRVPDRDGNMTDVLMSHPTLAGYAVAGSGGYNGQLIGRYANRIMGGQFTLDGHVYKLATANNAPDQLHGGPGGLNTKMWSAKSRDGVDPSLSLSVASPDGDMGFPGNVKVMVTYTLMHDNALKIEYRATTDKDTVLNLTNHAYFNLQGSGDVGATKIQLFADAITPSNVSDEVRPVKGTAYDFLSPRPLSDQLGMLAKAAPPAPAAPGRAAAPARAPGFDTNYVINGDAGHLRLAARATEPASGRVLEMWTTQPAFQFFTPGASRDVNFLQRGYGARPAFCLEAEHYPNAPNMPSYPSAEVTPGKPLHEITVYRFGTDKAPLPPLKG